jgi:hypothetical protein
LSLCADFKLVGGERFAPIGFAEIRSSAENGGAGTQSISPFTATGARRVPPGTSVGRRSNRTDPTTYPRAVQTVAIARRVAAFLDGRAFEVCTA